MKLIINKEVNKRYVFLYILPLSLIFCATLCQLYGSDNFLFSLLLQVRAISIIFFSFIGYYLCRNYKSGSLSKKAFVFSFYCYFITIVILQPNDLLTIAATLLFWPVTLWIGEKSRFSKETFNISALVIALFCNYMSYITITSNTNVELIMSLDQNQAVGAANSIYLILSTFPFVFLITNKKYRIALLILPILAFFMANKTTCLFAALASVGYYFFDDLRYSRSKWKIIATAILAVWIVLHFSENLIDFESIWEDVNSDVDSGGNGRVDIIGNVWSHFLNKGIINLLFGSGYFAVAMDTNLSAHNDFLEILYDYGILGLVLFILFWISLIRYRKGLPMESNIYRVYIISLIIYACTCLGSNFIVQQINMLFFALLWGTIDKYPIDKK